MTAQPAASSPAVRLSGRSGAIWLDGDALLLDQNDTRTRIPLEAIEAVHVEGPDRRSVAVVLTSADGSQGTVYRLDSRNSEASVATFADVVSRALPPRNTASRQDGGKLVQVTSNIDPRDRARPSRRPLWIWGASLASFYLGVLLIMIVSGEPTWANIWGVLVPVPLIMGVVLLGFAIDKTNDQRVLRRRGITVVATQIGSLGQTFEFIDAEGGRREIELLRSEYRDARKIGTNPERIEVTYDPLKPERTAVAQANSSESIAKVMTTLFGTLLLLVVLFPLAGFLVAVLS